MNYCLRSLCCRSASALPCVTPNCDRVVSKQENINTKKECLEWAARPEVYLYRKIASRNLSHDAVPSAALDSSCLLLLLLLRWEGVEGEREAVAQEALGSADVLRL